MGSSGSGSDSLTWWKSSGETDKEKGEEVTSPLKDLGEKVGGGGDTKKKLFLESQPSSADKVPPSKASEKKEHGVAAGAKKGTGNKQGAKGNKQGTFKRVDRIDQIRQVARRRGRRWGRGLWRGTWWMGEKMQRR